MKMTNDEARMTKEVLSANVERYGTQPIRISDFVILSSFGFRHSSIPRLLAFLFLLFIALPLVASDAGYVEGITEPFLDVTLSAPVAGIITVQKLKEGDAVKEGELILELDKKLEELEAARRKLVANNKKTDMEATEQLFKSSKAVSGEEREKKQVEFQIAAVEHEMAAEQLRRRSLISPLSGVITEIMLDVGEACQAYQPLARVVDTRRCYFIANVEAKAAAGLQQGQTMKLEIDTGAAPVSVSGAISFLSPVADPASGLLKVKVLFENSDGKIRPGVAGRLLLK